MFAAADKPAPPSAPDAPAPGPGPSASVPIASLSPGATGWRLRVRVTRRTPTKEYKTPLGKGVDGGVGRRFIAEVADAAGGQIRCVFLGSAVDRYDSLVAEGRTYEIAGGIVRKADRRFSRIDCPYDIALDDGAEVVPIEDDGVAPPHPAATSLASLESHRKGLPVTVLGVVARRDAPAQVTTSRSPAGLPRREVVLADSTHRGVLLVLWGDAAVSFRHIVGDVVLVQNARVSDFRGTSLACSVRTVVTGDPDLPEAEALRRWWRSHEEPPKVHLPPAPPWPQRTIAELQSGDEAPAWADKPFVLRCKVTGVRGGDPWYPACAVCRRKVIPTAQGGRWQCAKCATEDATMVPRFRLQMTVEDATGSREVTAFGGPAAVLLNHSAEEWAALSPADRSAALQSICCKPCVLRCVFGREAPAVGKGGGPVVLVQHIIEPAPPAPPTAPEP